MGWTRDLKNSKSRDARVSAGCWKSIRAITGYRAIIAINIPPFTCWLRPAGLAFAAAHVFEKFAELSCIRPRTSSWLCVRILVSHHMKAPDLEPAPSLDFIRERVTEDVKANRNAGRVHTRFPPEPNGYLHIGHAKALCLDFGIAAEFSGLCNLRFDDTNPSKEKEEFEENIMHDIRWLGFDWDDRLFYASDYFEKIYQCAVTLIQESKAYVDDLTADETREYRGTLRESGKNSPDRDRSVQ